MKLRCLLGWHKTPPLNSNYGGRWWWQLDGPHALCAYCNKEAAIGVWVLSAEGACAPHSDSWTIEEANEAWRAFDNRWLRPADKRAPGTNDTFKLSNKACRRCGHDKWYHYTGQLLKEFERPCKGDRCTCTGWCYTTKYTKRSLSPADLRRLATNEENGGSSPSGSTKNGCQRD